MDTVAEQPMYGWNALPWKRIERSVFKLQKRIYQAARRDDRRTVRRLQRLLMKSRSARLLAVRRVTQDNQGKKTAGVDGVKSLPPSQRLQLAETLNEKRKTLPVRRVWIDKPGCKEQRPLGIPAMSDRARQRLVQSVLEPEWEARFEPNSYGFRPGRACHDAIEAIFSVIKQKAKYALDTDVEKCFDHICHDELLKKVNASPGLRRQLKTWLKAGVLDDGKLFPTEQGTMQGGPVSPLLANIALHGLEESIGKKFPRPRNGSRPPYVIRFADDLVVLHDDLTVIKQCEGMINEWLAPMGLRLKPSKTRITHTLAVPDGKAGFDFLGFNVRQYPVGKRKSGKNTYGRTLGYKTIIKPSTTAVKRHVEKLREIIVRYQHTDQATLIKALNPVIRGWSNYHSTAVSSEVFHKLSGHVLFSMLWSWAKFRHSNKGKKWIVNKYWHVNEGNGWLFQTPDKESQLYLHHETPIRRHVKVEGTSSPYDGRMVYWSTRLGRHPEIPPRVAKLFKKQKGRCTECELFFREEDLLEMDHIIPKQYGGSDALYNRQLLHRHCHDVKTARDACVAG